MAMHMTGRRGRSRVRRDEGWDPDSGDSGGNRNERDSGGRMNNLDDGLDVEGETLTPGPGSQQCVEERTPGGEGGRTHSSSMVPSSHSASLDK